MHADRQAAILVNDLDSMVHRIEELPAHPLYTDALNHIHAAKAAIHAGRIDIHHTLMVQRFSGS